MILCDAGVLLCLVDRTQPQHNAYKIAVMRLAKPLVTTWSVHAVATGAKPPERTEQISVTHLESA